MRPGFGRGADVTLVPIRDAKAYTQSNPARTSGRGSLPHRRPPRPPGLRDGARCGKTSRAIEAALSERCAAPGRRTEGPRDAGGGSVAAPRKRRAPVAPGRSPFYERVAPWPREGPGGEARASRLRIATWLILPVVICLSQRLSHACLSISTYTVKLRMAH